MNKTLKRIRNIGLGAGLLYFFGSKKGKERRELWKERIAHLAGKGHRAWQKVQDKAEHRGRKIWKQVRAKVQSLVD